MYTIYYKVGHFMKYGIYIPTVCNGRYISKNLKSKHPKYFYTGRNPMHFKSLVSVQLCINTSLLNTAIQHIHKKERERKYVALIQWKKNWFSIYYFWLTCKLSSFCVMVSQLIFVSNNLYSSYFISQTAHFLVFFFRVVILYEVIWCWTG